MRDPLMIAWVVVNLFGGPDRQSAMACPQGTHPVVVGTASAPAREWAAREPLGLRWLVVSNAPESILAYGTGPRTLYKVRIPIPASGFLDLRSYLWHVNKTGAQRHIAFVLRFEDPSITWSYSDLRKEDAAQGIVATGICTAAAHLYGTLSLVGTGAGNVGPGGSLLLGPYTLANNAFRGAVHEVRVTGPAEKLFEVYAVVTDDTANWGTFDSPILAPGPHIRGSWPYCSQRVTSAPLEALANEISTFELKLGAPGA